MGDQSLEAGKQVLYRHDPQTKRAKQLVDDGAIGELRLIRSGPPVE